MIYVGDKCFEKIEDAKAYLSIRRELFYGKRYDLPESTIQAKTCSIRQKREPILGSTRWFRERGLYPQAKSLGRTMDIGSELMGEDSK